MDTDTLLGILLFFAGIIAILQSYILGKISAITEEMIDLSISQENIYLRIDELKHPEGKTLPKEWMTEKACNK